MIFLWVSGLVLFPEVLQIFPPLHRTLWPVSLLKRDPQPAWIRFLFKIQITVSTLNQLMQVEKLGEGVICIINKLFRRRLCPLKFETLFLRICGKYWRETMISVSRLPVEPIVICNLDSFIIRWWKQCRHCVYSCWWHWNFSLLSMGRAEVV